MNIQSLPLFTFTVFSTSLCFLLFRPPNHLTLLVSSIRLTLASICYYSYMAKSMFNSIGPSSVCSQIPFPVNKPVSLCGTPNRFCHKSNFNPLFSTQTHTQPRFTSFLHLFSEVTCHNSITLDMEMEDRKIICNNSHAKNIVIPLSCYFHILSPDLFAGFILYTEDIFCRERLEKRIDRAGMDVMLSGLWVYRIKLGGDEA